MLNKRQAALLSPVVLLAGLGVVWLFAADKPAHDQQREQAAATEKQGNYKDAYEEYRKLALDPAEDALKVADDLSGGVRCLVALGRVEEQDDFCESVIAAHKTNWRLLERAALTYAQTQQHFGFIVAGKFTRGNKRGGGRFVNTMLRDRSRALQLFDQALPLTKDETDKKALGQFFLKFAGVLLQGEGYSLDAWRLQDLTDLKTLPDYGEGYIYNRGYAMRGAPVDADGNPIYYPIPKSYEAARNDGERWRWMLVEAAEFDPTVRNAIDLTFADFLRSQFGVQTLATYGRQFGGEEENDGKGEKTGTFALHTLSDDETIARLATGIKRFKLPDEFNYLKLYERLAARGKSTEGEHARDDVAGEYENRRQYDKAADAWRRAIAEYGQGQNLNRQRALDQIVGNWGRFEPGQNQPAGTKAIVDFRYRNGKKVTFEAREIKVANLLNDVKAYLKGNPGQVDWEKTNIGNLGYRLVERNEQQYVGAKVAAWDVELKPRPGHVDERITVKTPLEKPGAYLLTGKMADGNMSRIIVWLSDTLIVRKNLEGRVLYYVADAVTGKPVANADVDLFGWRVVPVVPNQNRFRVETLEFGRNTDADGQLFLGQPSQPQEYQWLVTAKKNKDGLGGADRLAFLGFTNVWYGQQYDPEYNLTKVFVMTDRPVYRPQQTVQFKFWVRHAKYDEKDTSTFAGQAFTVQIHSPMGEKVFEKTFTADEYGGVAGDLPLPKTAQLGVYNLGVVGYGAGNFRVEEYKKPEFEVTVEAPKEPVRLGEKVEATIQAKYYFGAPVTQAKVKYKVLRSSYSDTWYPVGAWDWFYGPGYWWFAGDYLWYPGFRDWGCLRPFPIWWHTPQAQPEIVLENEVPIGADGSVKIAIDTKPAKELHGNQDHKYAITAEVVDESRRTIVGTGDVLVARKPFRVFAWVNRGYFRTGDAVEASFRAQTLDHKPVEGKGELTLYKISYDDKDQPVEKAVQTWKLDTNVEGQARQQFKAAEPGQFRFSYKLTDANNHTIEGGYLFVVRGEGFNGREYRFNDVELVTDKREYAPGDKVKLLVNTDRADATVLLFLRPTNNVYLAPQVLRLKGKSVEDEIAVVQRDMPNFFIEALTVHDGKVFTDTREVIVPPEKRVLNVEVLPSQSEYKPGEKGTIKLRLTDYFGKPFAGSTVVTMYDKSVEYISGGSNVPEIKDFFWKWRRHHQPYTESSVMAWFPNVLKQGEIGMGDLGLFGNTVVEEIYARGVKGTSHLRAEMQSGLGGPSMGGGMGGFGGGPAAPMAPAGAAAPMDAAAAKDGVANQFGEQKKAEGADKPAAGGVPDVEPTIRKNFADTAFWAASVTTNKEGLADIAVTMPENLTAWKVRVWAMGHGTKVGQGDAEVTTKKNLLVRLQAPRFFVQKDEVVLSANVHNYLKTDKDVKVSLELGGGTLLALGPTTATVHIPANGEKRVDWRVRVSQEGEAMVRMKALTDEESDAMEMRFPCLVHGMLKVDSFSGVLRPDKNTAQIAFTVPEERRINDSRLEIRYSPTLAGAMVDALPYLVEYPYGCTEQTLNRFLPTVITQRVLVRMNVDLKDVEKKRTNLNSQEIGDDKERAKGWKRFDRNPVFSEAEVREMSKAGVQMLAGQQCADGGWGWFSGFGEHSWPHTTALVVHGLQLARENQVTLPPGMLERGVQWLQTYQNEQVQWIKNFPGKTQPFKEHADNLDAFVYMVLVDAGIGNNDMREFLYRDRTQLAVYAKAMYGLALHKENQVEKLAMILKNIGQFVVQDDENQTAYLRLPADNYWWYWYGSEIEADSYYLKLLSRTNPKDETASRLVKYLLNNRKHATYWNSTRDTAVAIEALAEYMRASGEDRPDMTVEIWLDGRKQKEVKIDASNLFTFDNKVVLVGDAVETGKHTVQVKRQGTGPVYFNAYVTNFTLEDFITKAGLEVKVNRKYYKLTRVDKEERVPGARGQALGQKIEKYQRTELPNLAILKSGDLVEVELEIDSKNDYEYLIFEDPKAAGFEPLLVRSGYNPNDLGAYMELRDDRVCFFCRTLARGKHSVSYRMRAEIPGKFSALPAIGYAMYAPELKGNSDEIKVGIQD